MGLGCNSVLWRRQGHSAGCTGFCFYGISWETVREERRETVREERWETVWEERWETVREERRGSAVREELDVPKEWLRESDNFRTFVLKIFWDMNFSGIIVGAATFLIIGVCHPIVIKMEYYWGKGSWWLFLLAGLAFVAASIFVGNDVVATILGAAAFSCFWGIKEMFEQERRVLKGWFPENPARHDYYETIRKADCGGSTGSPTAPAGRSAPAGRQARRSNLSSPK